MCTLLSLIHLLEFCFGQVYNPCKSLICCRSLMSSVTSVQVHFALTDWLTDFMLFLYNLKYFCEKYIYICSSGDFWWFWGYHLLLCLTAWKVMYAVCVYVCMFLSVCRRKFAFLFLFFRLLNEIAGVSLFKMWIVCVFHCLLVLSDSVSVLPVCFEKIPLRGRSGWVLCIHMHTMWISTKGHLFV